MSTHKHIDKICVAAVAVTLIIALLFLKGPALGILSVSKAIGYENRLFDTSRVHTIDIVIDDWDAFISTAQSEEYSLCSVVIDREAIQNVGIRGKGNTSLSSVASMDSERYSFKIEFDQYDNTKSYHGLDKLCLNNLIQDNTYMKDYLVYRMMAQFGVNTPLCSFAYITVNGEDWGLYLAVEAVEESFLQRNYGSNYGELYKPDSMSFGGGRGNGKDFHMSEFTASKEEEGTESSNRDSFQGGMQMPGDFSLSQGDESQSEFIMPQGMSFPSSGGAGGFSVDEETLNTVFEELGLDTALLEGVDFNNVTMETVQEVLSDLDEETIESLMQSVMGGEIEMPDMGGFGGMGSSDVKLQYIDDDPNSYSNIFDNAKTNITSSDQNRLIASLKQLSEYEKLEEVVDIHQVLGYFVVHNFVVNGDSYTGSMIHNYYLYEEDGRLSMIPWDYNLAFGTFMGGNASASVNETIDEVLADRPMQAWIFSKEAYTEQYYDLYRKMLEQIDISGIIDSAYAMIAPYVQKDPTAFCTYDEFVRGVAALKEFCTLRSESVSRQLNGNNEAVATGDLNISDMGTMGRTMGGGRDNFKGISFGKDASPNDGSASDTQNKTSNDFPQLGADGVSMSERSERPEGTEFPTGLEMPEGVQLPSGFAMPEGSTAEQSTTFAPEQPEQLSLDSVGEEAESSTQEERPSQNGANGKGSARGGMTAPNEMMQFGRFSAASGENWVTVLVCAALLLSALIFAKFYKKRK